jgi:uncharacterized protein (DUF169 family)
MNRTGIITLNLPPVGIKLLDKKTIGPYDGIKLFYGVSYCEAIFEATFGNELILRPESVKICKWLPIVLGFKKAENEFECSIEPHLEAGTQGIYIAPLHLFREGVSPDIVIIRTKPDHYQSMIRVLGWDSFIDFTTLKQDRTALHTFNMKPLTRFSALAIKYFNGALDLLNRFSFWHSLTTFLFKSGFVTKIFDKFITRYMANMSICRNSFVIPFQQNRANISYFCTGGVAWGRNDSRNMTSGFPHHLFLKLDPHLDYPGKTGLDPRLDALEGKMEQLPKVEKTKSCMLNLVDGKKD